MINVTEYSTFKFHLMHLIVYDCGSFGLKLCTVWGRKLLLPAPHRACLPVCQRALAVPERAPEETVRAWPAQAS